MKKRVRIYKSPTGEGQFLNKTAQFLRKVQMGGTPTIEDLSYQEASQEQNGQTQEVDDNQLASLIMQDISNSRPKEEIVAKLVNIYGKDPLEATNLVNQMYTYLEEQSEAEKEEDSDEPSDEEITGGGLEDVEEGFYGDDVNNDISNQIVTEDDEVEDDDSEAASQMIMMRGGYVKAQEGMEIESQYPIVFPGIESYMPASMFNVMNDGYDALTEQAWQRPEFQIPQVAQNPRAQEEIVDEEMYTENEFKKGGGYKKNKTAYVNSVLKLVKKQMGGDQVNTNPKDLVNASEQSDSTGDNIRKSILDNYIGTLKNQSQIAVAKEQAKQQYEQMMQQQQMMQQGMLQAPMNYSEDDQMLNEAQFGGLFSGLFNRRRNQEGQERIGLFNRQPKVPKIPGGFGYGYPPVESIDVHKRGIFGRPKQYSVNFGQMPGYNIQGAGLSGYGYTGVNKTPARKIIDDEAVYVTNQPDKDEATVVSDEPVVNDNKVEEKNEVSQDNTTKAVATTTNTTPKTKTAVPTDVSKNITAKKVVDNSVSSQKIVKPSNIGVKAKVTGNVNRGPVSIQRVNKPAPEEYYVLLNPKKTDRLYKKTKKGWEEEYTDSKTGEFKMRPASAASVDMLNKKYGTKQFGGSIQDPFLDEYGNLQRFVYGGNEDPALAYIDQSDIDYSNSKDTTDPYFQNGGVNEYDTWSKSRAEQAALDEYNSYMNRTNKDGVEKAVAYKANPNDPIYKQILAKHTGAGQEKKQESDNSQSDIRQKYSNYPGGYPGYSMPQGGGRGAFNALFPANLAPKYSTQYMGARNAAGQQIPGVLGKNAQIKSIDVHKRGILGRPKQYSVTFSHQSSDPKKQHLITMPDEGSQDLKNPAFSKGYGALSQKEINRGDRQAGRQRPWHAPKKYERYFEEYELTPEEEQRYAENDLKYQKEKASAATLVDNMFNFQPKMTQAQIQAFQQNASNPTGLPSYAEFMYPTQTADFKNQYGQYNNGGALDRFIPKAENGNNPVVYTNNPAMDNISIGSLVTGPTSPSIQGLQGGIDWASMSGLGTVTQQNNDGTQTYGVDASYKGTQPIQMEGEGESYQIPQTYEPEGDVTFDYRTNTNVDPQSALLTGNAFAKGTLGMIDRSQNRKIEKEMYKNLTADNIFATDPSRDRGDYDSNSGLYRPNEMGQTWNSRSKQMGGQNDYLNEDPDYVEGDEVDMTEEELANFIANGGEVEYI